MLKNEIKNNNLSTRKKDTKREKIKKLEQKNKDLRKERNIKKETIKGINEYQ